MRLLRTKDSSARLASPRLWAALGVVACGLALAACGFGKESVSVAKDDPNYDGAVIFSERCSGCHTLSAAGAQGTGNRGERVQGPNLDQRQETRDDVLYAIRNGGFSGAIMPPTTFSTRSATAASRGRSCRRTSSSAIRRSRWPTSSPNTRAPRQRRPHGRGSDPRRSPAGALSAGRGDARPEADPVRA